MIKIDKEFNTPEELVIYFARVIAGYCGAIGKCENCIFGLDMGDGAKNACFLVNGYLPCTWNGLMRCCGVIKDGKENPSENV